MRFRTMRITTTTAVVLALLVPAAAAVGVDANPQTVDVSVIAADTLAISVDEEIYLGSVLPGTNTGTQGFNMNITNTTTEPWQVTVNATDFQAYTWECDDQDCNSQSRVVDPTEFFGGENLMVSGGDFDGWTDPAAIVNNTAVPATGGVIVTGTTDAYGSFGLDSPPPEMYVSVPGGATPWLDYYATVTYTLMNYTPTP